MADFLKINAPATCQQPSTPFPATQRGANEVRTRTLHKRSTGNLKMRMRATLDFGTFSAPLRAPEAEAQTPNESTCTVGRQSETRGASRVWRCACGRPGRAARARVRPDRDSTSTKRQPVYTTDVRQETLSMRTEPLARLCTAIRITRRQRAHATHTHTHPHCAHPHARLDSRLVRRFSDFV